MIKLALATLCLALSTVAYADSVVLTLDGNFAPPDYAFYSYTDTSGVVQDLLPVGPYITYFSGSGYNNTLVYAFCYDFNSPTNVGTPYSGSLEVLTSNTAMEATFLINQLNALGMFTAPLASRGAISMAIWELMNPSSTTSLAQFPTDPAALPYEAEAEAAVTDGSWTATASAIYPTWVPDNPAVQRFGVVFQDQPPVPEPATLALAGLGLLGLGVLGRKRRV
jgi:hypothetical protein